MYGYITKYKSLNTQIIKRHTKSADNTIQNTSRDNQFEIVRV